jgi:prephenate dehydratase
LSLERPLKVAYLGPRATFTHMAGMQQFGLAAQYVSVESIKDVFTEVERGRADYGVVPIENTTSGAVIYSHDMFIDSDLKIAAEIVLEVSQHLMNKSGKLEDITKIYTIPPAAAQCRQWLEKNLPSVPVLEAPSTARAAEMAADDHTVAAIASEMAAVLYGLQIAGKDRGQHHEITRFLVIAPKSPGRIGRDKTSIMFSIRRTRSGAIPCSPPLPKQASTPTGSMPVLPDGTPGTMCFRRHGRSYRRREGRGSDRAFATGPHVPEGAGSYPKSGNNFDRRLQIYENL